MLSKRDFIDAVKNNIANFLPEEVSENVEITETTVVKMNDQKLHGLVIKEKGSDAAPTFYMDEMFERYENGENMGELMSELAGHYGLVDMMPGPPTVDLSWDSVRDKLTVRLLEKQRNREFLSSMPYVSVGHGLAVIADINMGEDNSVEWRIAINNGVLDSLGVDKETLFVEAMNSSVVMEPAVLTDMSQALFSPEKENFLDRSEPIAPEEVGGMYVLTNESGSLGAAALFYPDVKEKAAELIGSDYYVLPSSTHEVILVPDTAGINAKELCDMVKQANRTVVDEKDILSDNVYHYSKDERRLDRVTAEPQLSDRVAEGR